MVSAPGRVNLIGEHTDYNDGFVLPMAIDAKIVLMGAKRQDTTVNLYSMDYQALDSFTMDNIEHTQENSWSNYIRGVCSMYIEAGYSLSGMDVVLQGNVPQGAGLSSSAALEIGTALLLKELNQLEVPAVEMVKLAQKAENEFVGVNCGIMDQFISMLGEQDNCLLIDCRSLDYQLVPVPFSSANSSVVVVDSGVKRGLVDSEYNLRRSQCEQAVYELKKELPKITSLRDVGIDSLDFINQLPEDLAKRARHVVTENNRVIESVKALKNGELEKFGTLMYQSHASLRDDYEVSCKELDLLVELAQKIPGTIGSRMTGAGFGGCTVSIVKNEHLDLFKEKVSREYQEQTGIEPRIFVFNASKGAHKVF